MATKIFDQTTCAGWPQFRPHFVETDFCHGLIGAGQSIKVDLPSKLGEEWFLIDPLVHAPSGMAQGPAEVVVMRRTDLRLLAGEAREASQASGPDRVIGEAQRREILVDFAAKYGLSEEELMTALEAFGSTDDPMDRGIAAYLDGEYGKAEASLLEAVETQESDFLESLRYLGATEYAVGDYGAAAGTFRKAVGLRGDDLALLSWFTSSLQNAARWSECEEASRRYLDLAIDQYDEEDPHAASAMTALAQLLKATNRLGEAEPLMRRAAKILFESLGESHPNSQIVSANLKRLLAEMKKAGLSTPMD